MEQLERTRTNAANDSNGQAFGLSGNLFLYPIGGLIMALTLSTICFGALNLNIALSIIVGLPFLVGPVVYVVFFRHNKPNGYDKDFIDTLSSSGYSLARSKQPSNPRFEFGADE